MNGKFEKISDDMFLRIRAAISQGGADGWGICKTMAFLDMETLLDDAQRYHNVSWIVAPAGSGKTTAANQFAKTHRNVFILSCSEDMHKPDFVEGLAKRIGIRNDGFTVRGTLGRIVDEVVKMDRPLLVFDEGDKLKDNVLQYFITHLSYTLRIGTDIYVQLNFALILYLICKGINIKSYYCK